MQVLLHSNRRIVVFAVAGGVTLAVLGTILASIGWQYDRGGILVVLGGLICGASVAAGVAAWRQLQPPRLVLDGNHLLVRVKGPRPYRIPIDQVECFFLGQGASGLPIVELGEAETANVVVRLAESATEWRQAETDTRLALWCDGYITVRGAWCAPINMERVQQMNHLLAEKKRALRREPVRP